MKTVIDLRQAGHRRKGDGRLIIVLWPTCRPDAALARAKEWESRAVGACRVAFVFGANDDISSYPGELCQPIGRAIARVAPTGTVKGVTHSATILSRSARLANDNDIVVLASDDYEAPQAWDQHLVDQLDDHDGSVIVNDGYKSETNIIPIPVMSGATLRRLNGIIYHPAYHHMFCDQELYDIVAGMGAYKNLRGTAAPIFHHRHWTFNGRDRDHHDMRNTEWWNEDKATYERRRTLPLAEKLKLPEGWTP